MRFFAQLAIVSVVAWSTQVSAQQITARYHPEKRSYLVGEPIIVVYEIVNNTPKAVRIFESNCRYLRPNEFRIDSAPPKPTIELYGCGEKIIAGSCLGSWREIRAQGRFRQRILLEGAFELDSPGNYHVRAEREA